MNIYIIEYNHRHGHDLLVTVADTEWAAVTRIRSQLVDEYSKEAVEFEEDAYGPLECRAIIRDGQRLNGDHIIRVLKEVTCDCRVSREASESLKP